MFSGRERYGSRITLSMDGLFVSRKQEVKVHKPMTKTAFMFSFCVVCVPKAEEHTGQLMLELIS